MNEVTMYGNDQCKYCNLAESLLLQKGVLSINKILVNHHDESLTAMIEVTGRKTTPQIFIGNRHIGGFDDLASLDDEGSLDTLLRT
jgi:glutaredoxin 3